VPRPRKGLFAAFAPAADVSSGVKATLKRAEPVARRARAASKAADVPAPPKGGGRQRGPSQIQKWATIQDAESRLFPAELKVPGNRPPPSPAFAPYRRGQPMIPVPSSKAINDRYDVAVASYASPAARHVLATTMDPAKKKQMLAADAQRRAAAAAPPPPRPSLWDRALHAAVPPEVRAITGIGKEAAPVVEHPVRSFENYRDWVDRVNRDWTLGGMAGAAARTGEQAGGALAGLGAKFVMGGAIETKKALDAIRARSGGRWGGPAPDETQTRLQASVIPLPTGQQALTVGEGLAKVGAGVPLATAGIVAHPIRAANEMVDMIRGQGALAVGLGVSLPNLLLNPNLKDNQRAAFVNQVIKQVMDDITSKYGPDVSFKQAVMNGYNEPLIHLVDALTVVAPGARLVSEARFMAAGATWREARALSRDPTRLGEFPHVEATHTPRTVTIRGEHVTPRPQVLDEPKHPLTRGFVRGYDVATRGLERAVGDKRAASVWTTPTRRGLRAEKNQMKRNVRRMAAQGAVLWHQVKDFVGEDPSRGERLFHTLQKPANVPEEVWLRGMLADTERMLAGRPVMRDRRLTPRERQLMNEVKKFRAQVEKAGRDRWLTRIADVHHEQGRLNYSILAAEDHLRQIRQYLRDTEADDTLDAETRGRRIGAARDDINHLVRERNALKAQLDDLTIEQPAVESPRRTELSDHIQQLPNVTPEQHQALMGIFDTAARQWAKEHPGQDPGEYYTAADGFNLHSVHLLEHYEHGLVPEEALTQTRKAPAINADRLDPKGEIPRSEVSGRLVFNKEHGDLVHKLETEEANYEQVKAETKDEVNAAKKAHEAAKKKHKDPHHPERAAAREHLDEVSKPRVEAKAKLDKAIEDELYSRVWNSSQASKGMVPESPARRTLATRLVNAYKGRSGALPLHGKTPQDMERLMALLTELMNRGKAGRYWYENSAKSILRMANGDKETAAKIAQLVAIYSPQKAVIPNLGEAIKAYNAWLTDHEITNGQDWQIEAATNALNGTKDWEGRKTNNFYRNFLEDIDRPRWKRERTLSKEEQARALKEGRIYKGQKTLGSVTADMWMARVFGYLRKGVTEGRYDVIESVVEQLAKEKRWKPKQVQAAIWTAIKDISDDVSANVDFAQAMSRHHGLINYEVAPGETFAGAFGDLYKSWDPETRQAFLVANTHLVDNFLTDAGVLHLGSELGPGMYERAAASGAVVRTVAAQAKGIKYTVSPTDRAMFTYVSAAIGRATLQDAVAWARPFVHTTRGHAETVFVDLGRAATDEEAVRLYDLLNPVGEGERVFVVHAGKQGVYLRKAPWRDDIPNFAPGKGYSESFQGQVDAAIGEVLPGHKGGYHVSDGDLVENDWSTGTEGYDSAIESSTGNAGRPGQVLRLRGLADRLASEAQALRDEFTADSAAAAERHTQLAAERAPAEPGVAQPRGPPPVERLAQSRKGDLLGAVQFLNTPEGGRILYLTKQADVSTLLHELYGHGVNEISRAYPKEWADVEAFFGKPLAEWDRADHERFARMAERYFMEGRGPTPELVDTFAHMKAWMRSIYGAEARLGPMPEPVRAVFDRLFGTYNDDNVFRVAGMMTSIPHELRATQAHTLWEYSSNELAALRRRGAMRDYRRSRVGLQEKLDGQRKAIDEKYGDFDSAPEAEKDAVLATYSQLMDVVAQETQAAVDRTTGLRQRVMAIEDALANPDDPGFEGALGSLNQLQARRDEILRSIFGSRYDEVFSQRVDLMADFLAEQGLIPDDFARGTATYVHHGSVAGQKMRIFDRPAKALTGQTVGKPDQSYLNLNVRNQLLRWQNGDLHADPKVVFEAWNNAQAFAFVKELSDRLKDVGRKLRPDEPITDNMVLVMDGTPLPQLQRASLKAATTGSTADVQKVMTALEGRDPEVLEATLKDYADNLFKDGGEFRQELEAYARESGDPERALAEARLKLNIYVVDKNHVQQLFRQMRGPSNILGKGWDITNTIARWSMIYTNPSYIPINFIGNSFFLLAQQGPLAAQNLLKAAKMMHSDSDLATLVAVETGELPALAAAQYGRGGQLSHYFRSKEEAALRRITAAPDKMPRIAAWIYEAKRMGYDTAEKQKALLRGETPRDLRNREIIGNRATEIMVNFDRLADWERLHLTRFLFIWPWIRGATAWPFYYAREYPLATGISAQLGYAEEQRRKAIMGDVPLNYRDLIPLGEAKGGLARVMNVMQFSPTSQAATTIDTLISNIQSVAQNHNLAAGTKLSDFLQPFIAGGIQLATGMNDYGQATGGRDALIDNALNFVPFGQYGRQLLDPSKRSKVYTDRGPLDVTTRKFTRFLPQDVSLVRLHAFQTQQNQKTTAQKTQDKIAATAKRAGVQTSQIPQSVRHALFVQQAYEDLVALKEKDIAGSTGWYPKKEGQTKPTLTDRQRAEVVYALYRRYLPGASIPQPSTLPDTSMGLYVDAFLYGNTQYGVPGILAPLVSYRKAVSKAKKDYASSG